jgi:hypothetical protein
LIAGWLAGVDPTTVVTLAALMLLDDVRRVPQASMVLQRTLAGRWRACMIEPKPVAILSWWSPLSTAVLLPVMDAQMGERDRHPAERWRRVRWHARILAVLGAGIMIAIVAGLPILSARFGGGGFIAATAVILTLCLLTGLVGYASLVRLGKHRGAAARRALALCSPFAAPGAYGDLLQTVAVGAEPIRIAHWLMRPADFADWIRRRAWDALRGHADPELEAVLSRTELHAIVSRRPTRRDGSAVAICERCGATWREIGDCPECGVSLIRIGGPPRS